MSELQDLLLVELECPVCTYYMHPPIRQCVSGHSFCSRCHLKVARCPTCRQQILHSARNYTLERLHAKLQFPCRNRQEGCEVVEPGPKIKLHENGCTFTTVQCPLRVINDCEWVGRVVNIVDHCKTEHPNNIFSTNKQLLTCANFLHGNTHAVSTYFFIIFNIYDQLFKCAWDVNFETGIMRWCVFLLSHAEVETEFNFKIKIRNQNNRAQKLSLRGRCPVLLPNDDTDIFDKFSDDFLLSNYDIVKKFCKTNDFYYLIKIVKPDIDKVTV